MHSSAIVSPPMRRVRPTREQRHRIRQHLLNTYDRLRDHPLNFVIDEYEPRGRFFNFDHLPSFTWSAWWRGKGIPHEVSRPPVNDPGFNEGVLDISQPWIPFKRWMMEIARTWTRPWPRDLELDPELFGNNIADYHCTQINFFRVMRYRLSVHKSYAYWTEFARKHQYRSLTETFEFLDGRQGEEVEFDPALAETARMNHRQSLIMLTLVGLNNYNVEDETLNNAGVDELRYFIRSPVVMDAWREFHNDYLQYHPDTRNPVWSTLQPALENREIQTIRRRYYLSIDPDKNNWTLMDHAVRFIMRVYYYGLQMCEAREREHLEEVHWPWEQYFYSETFGIDMEDRHWFGFSLLMLLVSSWQYNRIYPHPEYARILVPALYAGYQPQDWDFIEGDAGMVDLSPTSPWKCENDVRSKFDFSRAYLCGFIGSWEGGRLYDSESDTPIDNDGYRVRGNRPKITRNYDQYLSD
ncbi:hypothetical protein F4813DRAFT_394226 [Daldinia decipiens]|uniref:uncharacterized protein n=1 Tax=Daldinia decipiens TaxID=326647 RepID=UPI0020C43747|nr:uncharacterized protein F4813DRAFT_394226 [Daldinia decipiens]KAI1652877.1 hypothetical protein F4813DRAFT_394226 [Daldinia decipiens]